MPRSSRTRAMLGMNAGRACEVVSSLLAFDERTTVSDMELDVVTLSRAQFALTITFHYLFPPLSIGLGCCLVVAEAQFLRTGDRNYESIARFFTRLFSVNFAVGVATGIVMEFEFGTNWATYSRFVGDVFGSALAAEGISFALFLLAYVLVTIATFVYAPHALRNFERLPAAWVLVVLHVLAIANVPRSLYLQKPVQAFASSCAVVAVLCFLFGMAMYPNHAFSRDGGVALDIFNSCSSEGTLARMQLIAFLGMPCVASYTVIVYVVFRGRVKLGKFSY